MKHRLKDEKREPKYSEKYLSHCHFVHHHSSHIKRPGTESGHSRRKSDEQVLNHLSHVSNITLFTVSGLVIVCVMRYLSLRCSVDGMNTQSKYDL